MARIPYINADTRKHNLCTKESLLILYNYGENSLNKIIDVLPGCNHKYAPTFLNIYKDKTKNKNKIKNLPGRSSPNT